MCWTTERKINEKIASKDIICFKLFHKKDIIYRTIIFGFINLKPKIIQLNSIVRHFEYIPYKKQKSVNLHKKYLSYPIIDFTHCKIKKYIKIEEGYHSYATLDRAKHIKTFQPSSIIVECIIPKDAIYYLNEDDEIVSSNIIVTDKIIK